MLNRIGKKIKFEIARMVRPHMIGGYKRFDGRYLRETRISNTTFIDSPENLDIGDHVFIGHFNFIEASHGITIREGCQVTNYISIITHSSHISIRLYGKEYGNHKDHLGYVKGPVYIGEYTFIGPHSLIMPNSRIGKGSIVAAFSLVEGDYPDFAILKGNPAKVTGDTRDIDREYLDQHPDLREYHQQWSQIRMKNNPL
jgi:acetyltransferase-like isoleucine patch superfamily enzyme